jgi:RNA polymerase sigma-70 factor (ECF subfamily)
MLERSPQSVRQLASRARRRVSGAAPPADTDLGRQREVIDAFQSAARGGDFDALLALLDPDVVLRADAGAVAGLSREVRGAGNVASRALMFSRVDLQMQPALVNGAAGVVATRDGKPFSVMVCTIRGGKIAEIDILADPERLRALDLTVLAS